MTNEGGTLLVCGPCKLLFPASVHAIMFPLLVIHWAATFALLGVIWAVQCVLYPLFARVPSAQFADYHAEHVRRVTRVVAPLMLLEAASGIVLVAGLGLRTPVGLSLFPLGVVWASTFFIQVPLHRRLATGWSAARVRQLVRGNWIRTAAWTLRGILVSTTLPNEPWG